MSNDSSKKKPGFQFNIIKDDPLTGHKGQNFGAISVENVAPVYIDIDTQETFIDIGGLHGRTEVERRVKWVNDIEDPHGDEQREFGFVWVTVERTKDGPVYEGVTSCYEMINKTKKRGYKLMHEHVNQMDRSMKGHIIIDEMDQKSRSSLKKFLMNHNPEMWENSEKLKEVMKDD